MHTEVCASPDSDLRDAVTQCQLESWKVSEIHVKNKSVMESGIVDAFSTAFQLILCEDEFIITVSRPTTVSVDRQ